MGGSHASATETYYPKSNTQTGSANLQPGWPGQTNSSFSAPVYQLV